MEVGTTTNNLTARLPILNPGDYDLCLVRIEQYFLMTNYSQWEVIKNGNKVLRRTIGTVEQEYEPTTAKEKQDRRNEMKVRATLLMALLNKDQLKFHSYQDAKLLMKAIEKRRNGSLMGDGHANNQSKKVYQENMEEDGHKWSKSWFDKSKVECYNCHKHRHFARVCRFPRNQENKGRENNTRTIEVETPTQNALIAQDGIGGYDWSYQAEKEKHTNHALMAFTSSGSSSSSDSEVYSYSKKCLESVEARLAHYKKNEVAFEESINVLNLEVKLRDNALVEDKIFFLEKAGKKRDELKLTLEKFQNPSKSLNNLLESQVIDKFKTGLRYNAASSTAASPVAESFMNSSEMLENQENNKSKSDKGYHAVPLPYTGNFIPFKLIDKFKTGIGYNAASSTTASPAVESFVNSSEMNFITRKPDITFMDEIVKSENIDVVTVVTPSNVKKVESGKINTAGASVNTAVRPVNTAGSKTTVNTVRVKDTTARDWEQYVSEKGKGVNAVKASALATHSRRSTRKKELLTVVEFLEKVEFLGIKREFSVARTPQQNGVAERKNKTLIEAARTMEMGPDGHDENEEHNLSRYILIPFCTTDLLISQGPKDSEEDSGMKPIEVDVNGASDKDGRNDQATRSEFERLLQQDKQTNSTNSFNTAGTPVSAVGPSFTYNDPSSPVNAAKASNAFEDHLFE
ncbi:ribonuclease H-like domain-containing protein [Tanacetum coccineum]